MSMWPVIILGVLIAIAPFVLSVPGDFFIFSFAIGIGLIVIGFLIKKKDAR